MFRIGWAEFSRLTLGDWQMGAGHCPGASANTLSAEQAAKAVYITPCAIQCTPTASEQ